MSKAVAKHNIRHLSQTRKWRSVNVGIITMPHEKQVKYGTSHIMKSYVDWFESRGVRVIPIPYDTTQHELYFNNVNGILIPGGETDFVMKNKIFMKTCRIFLELALKSNTYFPIWGTCLGYEIILSIIGDFKTFKKSPSYGKYHLKFTYNGSKSKLMNYLPKGYINYLQKTKTAVNNKEYGISPTDFLKNDYLRKFFYILATTVDDNGEDCVAIVEAKRHPIYGIQWHPERSQNTEKFADFFINELIKNRNRTLFVPKILSSIITPHKCIQYPDMPDEMCYFF